MQETWVRSLGLEDPLEKEIFNIPIFLEYWNILSQARIFQYSCLGNPMDRGAWQAAVHEVAKSWIWLRD